MPSKIQLFDSEASWLDYKKAKFSASQIHRLLTNGEQDFGLGVGAITYCEELFSQMIADEVIDPYVSIDMQHGIDTESEANEELEKHYGLLTLEHYGGNQFLFAQYNDQSGASPDGLIYEGDKIIQGYEIKCPTSRTIHLKRLLYWSDGLSIKQDDKAIYAQIQFNMMCFDLKKWSFVSYYPYMHDKEAKLHVVEVEADAEFQSLIKEKIEAATKYMNFLSERYFMVVGKTERMGI